MKKYGLLIGVSILLYSCGEQARISTLEQRIAGTTEKGENSERLLMHLVCFNVIDSFSDTDAKLLKEQLTSLKNVKGVESLKAGTRAHTGDDRLEPTYDWVLEVGFSNEEGLKNYSKDAHHLEVRGKVKHLFKSRPYVIDYWVD